MDVGASSTMTSVAPSAAVKTKKSQQMRTTIVNDATQQWIRQPVHLRQPLHFLQMCSHCINDTIYYASLEDLKNSKTTDVVQQQQPHPQMDFAMSAVADEYIIDDFVYDPVTVPSSSSVVASNDGYSYDALQTMPFHVVTATDPPPLAFFPKAKLAAPAKRFRFSSEPPPLVPIRQPS